MLLPGLELIESVGGACAKTLQRQPAKRLAEIIRPSISIYTVFQSLRQRPTVPYFRVVVANIWMVLRQA